MFRKICDRTIVYLAFLSLISMFLCSIPSSGQEKEDNLFNINLEPTDTLGEYWILPVMDKIEKVVIVSVKNNKPVTEKELSEDQWSFNKTTHILQIKANVDNEKEWVIIYGKQAIPWIWKFREPLESININYRDSNDNLVRGEDFEADEAEGIIRFLKPELCKDTTMYSIRARLKSTPEKPGSRTISIVKKRDQGAFQMFRGYLIEGEEIADSVATGVISIKHPYTFKVEQFVLEKRIKVSLIKPWKNNRWGSRRYLKKDIDYSYNENTGIITLKEPLPVGYQIRDILVTGNFKKNIPEIKSGEYLKSDYIDAIEKTHSPYASLRSSKEPILLIAYQGEFDLVLVHYFHEFHDGLNIMENGNVHWTGSGITVTVDGDNLILTDYDTEGPLHYVYVGDAQRYVAKKVVVDDYVDSEGKTYSFKEDGTAFFGDVQFQYVICLDFVERWHADRDLKMRDYFWNKITRELYEYEIEDGVMSIYKTSGDRSQYVEPEAFLKLKKKSK